MGYWCHVHLLYRFPGTLNLRCIYRNTLSPLPHGAHMKLPGLKEHKSALHLLFCNQTLSNIHALLDSEAQKGAAAKQNAHISAERVMSEIGILFVEGKWIFSQWWRKTTQTVITAPHTEFKSVSFLFPPSLAASHEANK